MPKQILNHWLTSPESSDQMPLLFMGHGSPMNGIADNVFSRQWAALGQQLPQPKAVLCVSAHWLTRGTQVTAMEVPPTIHDFGGFPEALYQVQYPAPGEPVLAAATAELLAPATVGLDHEWGLDHGAWSVIRQMFPKADIPVIQLSLDYYREPRYHYELARQLSALRRRGVLILGSGNIVHNLRMVAWDKLDKPAFGYDWALEVDARIKALIETGDHTPLIDYRQLGEAGRLAIPTPDHYLPLLYILGLVESDEPITFFNDEAVGGSITMTSVQVG